MKIKVSCESLNFGGNTFKKGDIIDVNDVTGNIILERNQGAVKVTGNELSFEVEPPVSVEPVVEEPKPEVPVAKPKKEKDDFDLNGDGKVDRKDLSLAAKVMRSVRRSLKKKK